MDRCMKKILCRFLSFYYLFHLQLVLFYLQVMNFSKSYTHVITSGGIGPTHDDLTFEGVARAFGEQVHPHPELVALCKQFFGTDDVSSPKLKLAFIPQSGVLRYGIDKTTGVQSKYPLVIVKNVYIFPGVPSLLESAFTRLEDIFRNPTAHFHTRDLYIKQDELTITGVLNATNQRFKDRVITGSYPDFYNNYYNVKLTFESAHVEDLDAITTFLRENLASDALVDYDPDPIGRAAEKVYGLAADKADPVFSLKVDRALKIIEESFERYGADGVCIGFNGGKDCTALLYMVHAVVQRKFPHGSPALQALYIRRGQSFPEAELFVKKCTSHYQLNLININGRIKDALAELKQTHSCLSAVLMGTRRTDPHSEHLRDFAPTDPGWPEYMRVNPMLDWSYIDLWTFIRRLSLPYCTLYDRGYTSLGSMEKTHPNPALQHIDSKGIVTYRPAYELTDSESERAGRN